VYRIFSYVATAVGVHRLYVRHVLLHCPKYEQKRADLIRATGSEDLRAILTHVASAQAAARWFVRCGTLDQFKVAHEIELEDVSEYASFRQVIGSFWQSNRDSQYSSNLGSGVPAQLRTPSTRYLNIRFACGLSASGSCTSHPYKVGVGSAIQKLPVKVSNPQFHWSIC
jgi:hypothetical protein